MEVEGVCELNLLQLEDEVKQERVRGGAPVEGTFRNHIVCEQKYLQSCKLFEKLHGVLPPATLETCPLTRRQVHLTDSIAPESLTIDGKGHDPTAWSVPLSQLG